MSFLEISATSAMFKSPTHRRMRLVTTLLILGFAIAFSTFSCFGQYTTPGSGTVLQRADTLRALDHLYRRKHNWGVARALIFGLCGGVALVNTINYKPTTVQLNPNQSVQVDSDLPPAINYVVIAATTMVAITGVVQAGRFSKTNLQKIKQRYSEGKRLPADIRQSLRRKDFK
jgi:hypothetical protein